MTSGKLQTETLHWRFIREEGGCVMDYWPVKGTWRCPINGERGSTLDPFDAVDVASRLSCAVPVSTGEPPREVQPTLF